jgi:hypothetical protein
LGWEDSLGQDKIELKAFPHDAKRTVDHYILPGFPRKGLQNHAGLLWRQGDLQRRGICRVKCRRSKGDVEMLCVRGKDLQLEFSGVQADDQHDAQIGQQPTPFQNEPESR